MLAGYKTYIVAGLIVVRELINWWLDGTPPDITTILGATGLATLRAGVAKQ